MLKKPMYYVWNQNRSLPAKQHFKIKDAIEEAERLSKKHPGQVFVVLYVVKLVGPFKG